MGVCVDCLSKPAVDRSNQWCLGCLRKRINAANPMPKQPSDSIGRKHRGREVGGAPDMRTTEQREEGDDNHA